MNMDSMQMNMTDTSSSTSSDSMEGMAMMKTYLHFTPGDTLIFKTVVPTSTGGMVGACIILFLISVADHYLRAVCRGIHARFTQRTRQLASAYYFVDPLDESRKSQTDNEAISEDDSGASKFIFSHEMSRGALSGLSSTVDYFLMLIVMTFNAAFIISIILGVVVGDVAFGRLYRH